MTKSDENNKKEYQAPQVIDYGDLRELTRGSRGPNKDGGAGNAGSRQ